MGWSAMADRTLRKALRTFRQDLGAVYVRSGFPDTPLQDVIFDDTYFSVDTNTGAEVSSQSPVMGVRTADLPTGRKATTDRVLLTRNGIDYEFTITDVQPDGEAGTTLFLSKSPRA
jgi:hypothetical protein